MLRLTARLDLDDRTGTTAGGLHLAAMGRVWQALSRALLGSGRRATRCSSILASRRPGPGSKSRRLQGTRVRFRFEPESVAVHAERSLRIRFPGDRAVRLGSGRGRFQRGLAGWEEVPS